MTVQKRDVDEVTGIETTGHEWDGLKELNKPLPRWWALTFYATILWAIGYWVVYPAWPTLGGYTRGMLGYSQRATVADEVKAAQAAQGTLRDQLAAASLEQIKREPDLLRFALAGGGAAFQANCAPCHGRGAQGFVGYPNLNDDDWIWGGTIEDIHKTITNGVRSDQKDARASQMPRYGLDKLLEDARVIPDEAKANSAAMSVWIDSNRVAKRRKRGRKTAYRPARSIAPQSTVPTKRSRKREADATVGRPTPAQPNSVTGTPLRIPYGNKEVALKLGARYGSGGWYAPPGVDLSPFGERGWLL